MLPFQKTNRPRAAQTPDRKVLVIESNRRPGPAPQTWVPVATFGSPAIYYFEPNW